MLSSGFSSPVSSGVSHTTTPSLTRTRGIFHLIRPGRNGQRMVEVVLMQLTLIEGLMVASLIFIVLLLFQMLFIFQLPPAGGRRGRDDSPSPGHPDRRQS